MLGDVGGWFLWQMCLIIRTYNALRVATHIVLTNYLSANSKGMKRSDWQILTVVRRRDDGMCDKFSI